jgi:sarcosine oxidase
MSERYDVIVAGVGSMGAATCRQLARRGVRVLGLEQFDIPNVRSSHHGHSRMVRLAYFEHPDYVALLQRSYVLWDELGDEAGSPLLQITGGLYLGRPDSELVGGSLRAAREYGLPHEVLDHAAVSRRFPQFHMPGETIGFFETRAGFVSPEQTVAACARLAMMHGAELHAHEPIRAWTSGDDGVTVTTDVATYHADRLVICSGAWSPRLVSDLGVPLRVSRQAMAWFWPRRPEAFAQGTMPVWAYDPSWPDRPGALYYGFPMQDDSPGLKVALHWPDETCDPDLVDRTPRPAEIDDLRRVLRQQIPDGLGPMVAARVCVYTNSPDGHFIVDRHPRHECVVLGVGFSGHGFKFVPVIAEALADLATQGRSELPIEFLSLARFAGDGR